MICDWLNNDQKKMINFGIKIHTHIPFCTLCSLYKHYTHHMTNKNSNSFETKEKTFENSFFTRLIESNDFNFFCFWNLSKFIFSIFFLEQLFTKKNFFFQIHLDFFCCCFFSWSNIKKRLKWTNEREESERERKSIFNVKIWRNKNFFLFSNFFFVWLPSNIIIIIVPGKKIGFRQFWIQWYHIAWSLSHQVFSGFFLQRFTSCLFQWY